MENMELYNRLRAVPQEAKTPIGAGRLKGFTDINPMWRIKALTETFGPCGIGWWYRITDKRLEGSDIEVRAFVDIELQYIWNGQESKPIPGTGGSSFLTKERNGAYTSDECYKMALTDALSVAAKAIGVGADVYYNKDRDKYTTVEQEKPHPQEAKAPAPKKPVPPPDINPDPMEAEDGYYHCKDCGEIISGVKLQGGRQLSPKDVAVLAMQQFGTQLCYQCGRQRTMVRKQEAMQ